MIIIVVGGGREDEEEWRADRRLVGRVNWFIDIELASSATHPHHRGHYNQPSQHEPTEGRWANMRREWRRIMILSHHRQWWFYNNIRRENEPLRRLSWGTVIFDIRHYEWVVRRIEGANVIIYVIEWAVGWGVVDCNVDCNVECQMSNVEVEAR